MVHKEKNKSHGASIVFCEHNPIYLLNVYPLVSLITVIHTHIVYGRDLLVGRFNFNLA